MIQATVLYARPDDPDAFEASFASKHMPLVQRVAGPVLTAMYRSKCPPNPAGASHPTRKFPRCSSRTWTSCKR